MTDLMSEAYGQQLVARTTFEREAIWLPLLALHHLNFGTPVIAGKVFTHCVLEGPAMIAPLPGTTFDNCDMGSVENSHSLLFKAQGPKLVGVIGFKDCIFERCQFRLVGFSGHHDFVDAMMNDLSPIQSVRL